MMTRSACRWPLALGIPFSAQDSQPEHADPRLSRRQNSPRSRKSGHSRNRACLEKRKVERFQNLDSKGARPGHGFGDRGGWVSLWPIPLWSGASFLPRPRKRRDPLARLAPDRTLRLLSLFSRPCSHPFAPRTNVPIQGVAQGVSIRGKLSTVGRLHLGRARPPEGRDTGQGCRNTFALVFPVRSKTTSCSSRCTCRRPSGYGALGSLR